MLYLSASAARRLPTPLLLGLLALLLWGQCNWGRRPPAAEVYAYLAHVDSLAATSGQRHSLRLVLKAENRLRQPCRLDSAYGTVLFGERRWPFDATRQFRGRRLADGDTLTTPLTVLVVLPADSLHQLQLALREGSTGGNNLMLDLHVRYFAADSPFVARLASPAQYLPAQNHWQ